MYSLSLPFASQNLNDLINHITETNEPIKIKGSENEVIMISKEDWTAIQETIYLNSIPGYVDSLKEVINSPKKEWINAKELGL